jgi:hypothetical protein
MEPQMLGFPLTKAFGDFAFSMEVMLEFTG